MFHLCAMPHSWYTAHVPWYFNRKMYDSMFLACKMPHFWCATCVPWYFRHEIHIYMLWETWSTQTRGMNLENLCRVSLHLHACKSEVINQQYCTCSWKLSNFLHIFILLCTKLQIYLSCFKITFSRFLFFNFGTPIMLI